jgi:agmatinase
MSDPFDPDAAAAQDSGMFGLDSTRQEAAVVLVPVPFDATVSYGTGTAEGPAAILRASHQVDLFDSQTGRPYRRGIHLVDPDPAVLAVADEAAALARPLIDQGGATAADGPAVARIDGLCGEVHAAVEAQVEAVLVEGRLPGVIGGDHSVALGGIRAVARHHPGVGILQVDAHADLRPAFEGLRYSHASIMDNVLGEADGVARLVQVGIRDVGEGEVRRAAEDPRIVLHYDMDWKTRVAGGEGFLDLCRAAVEALPEQVHVSFDIDGLDPALCPHTGTPVPGGLQFHEACLLLQVLVDSGRRIVGFDLTEVAPGDDEWDANVGARVLYKLIGFALLTR